MRRKALPLVIDAVTAASYSRPIGLLLVGGGRETPKLRRQIAGNPHIRLVPAINGRAELARLMASADALVHGCEAETFCIVAAEASASGLTLIAPIAAVLPTSPVRRAGSSIPRPTPAARPTRSAVSATIKLRAEFAAR